MISAMKKITTHNIGGMPVVNEFNQPVGFISDGDIIRFFASKCPLFVNAYSFSAISQNNELEDKLNELSQLKVFDIIKNKLIVVHVNDSIEEVCRVLTENKIKKVPVVNHEKQIVGIINSSSITKKAMNYCIDYLNKKRES